MGSLLQLFKLQRVLLLQVAERDFACEPNPTHRENARLEVDMVEVPDDDCQEGEESLVTVDQASDVPDPQGQVSERLSLKPKSQSCQDHDRRAPNDGVILQLLNPVEPAELGLLVAQAQVALEHLPDVKEVLLGPPHVPQLFAPSRGEKVKQVPNCQSHQHDRTDSVDDAPQFGAAGETEKPLRPRCFGVTERQPGDDEEGEGNNEHQMLQPFVEGKAFNIFVRQRVVGMVGRDGVAGTPFQVVSDVKGDVNAEEADEPEDEELVEHFDEPIERAFRSRARKVNFPDRHFFAHPRVATPASFGQVFRVDG